MWNRDTRVGDLNLNMDERYKKISIQDLLAHKSGLPAWRNFWMDRLPGAICRDASERNSWIAQVLDRIQWQFQTEEIYSDVGFIILGSLLRWNLSSRSI